jgi:adenylyltransferase/sulfurtransferase
MSDTVEPLSLEIAVDEVQRLLHGDDSVLLIDCREPEEHALCSIAGAVSIPMAELPGRIAQVAARDERFVVHCHHGVRSLRVVHWLRQQGYSRAQSMAGGIDQWSAAIDPSVPRYRTHPG